MNLLIIFLAIRKLCCSGPSTRKAQAGCDVVLNEIGRPKRHEAGFIEIAKICPPGIPTNQVKSVGGYLVLVIEAGLLRLVAIENLLRRSWKYVKVEIDDTPPVKARHSKHSLPKGSRRKNKRLRLDAIPTPPPTAHSDLLLDSVTEPCHLVFDCGSARLARSVHSWGKTNLTTNARPKRDVTNGQKNVRAVYVTQAKVPPDGASYLIILLKLPKSEARVTDGRKEFSVGGSISPSAIKKIQKYFHDFVVFEPTGSNTDQSALLDLLPENVYIKFLEAPKRTKFYSLSKCDLFVGPISPDGFVESEPTPHDRNECKSYRSQPFTFSGMNLNVQAKKLISNVVIGLRDKKTDVEWMKLNEVKAASEIINLHEGTIYNVMKEYEINDEFDGPHRRSSKCPVTDIDSEKQRILYDVIAGFYKQNVVPYFANIYAEFVRRVNANQVSETSEVNNFECSRHSFSKILRKNNYRYGKISERDAVLFNPNILKQRKWYLEMIAKYDADPDIDVVYQDETWIDPYSRCRKGWRLRSFCNFRERGDFSFANAKIGGVDGFVPGTSEIYMVSKSKVQADYHGNINGKKFYDWMEKVLAALKRKTVIVIDNSVSTAPTSDARKPDVLHWLNEKYSAKTIGWELIPSHFQSLKLDELRKVNKTIKDNYPQYRVDELVRSKGHIAIRLPPYQADLNPIELVWSDLKRMTRERNVNQNARETLQISREILASYSSLQWSKHIQHVKRIENEYRTGDAAFEQIERDIPDLEVNFVESYDDGKPENEEG